MPERGDVPGKKDDISSSGIKHSLFLNNLEQWIDEIISQDGLAEKELIKTIRNKFELAMQANIEHHMFMAKNASKNGEHGMADRYRLMAEIYQSLLHKPATKLQMSK